MHIICCFLVHPKAGADAGVGGSWTQILNGMIVVRLGWQTRKKGELNTKLKWYDFCQPRVVGSNQQRKGWREVRSFQNRWINGTRGQGGRERLSSKKPTEVFCESVATYIWLELSPSPQTSQFHWWLHTWLWPCGNSGRCLKSWRSYCWIHWLSARPQT